MDQPLANKLRPTTLADFIGQTHIVDKNGIINKLLEKGSDTTFFPALLFWGPPGSGKTTLARIIAKTLGRDFYEFSAVNASVKDIENVIGKNPTKKSSFIPLFEQASDPSKKTPVVFIDEIHRFNKAQQDALLPYVEQGKILFIAATTENPSFEVIGPLLSRCRVVILKQHQKADLFSIIDRALTHLGIKIIEDAKDFLADSSNGDARVAINVIEIAYHLSNKKLISVEDIKSALQKNQLSFDLRGDEYYNTISALHKTLRGSDPNAALYYLARMLEAGQDPIYITRRLVRFASEDIGVLDPQALVLAVSTFLACEKLGMPECNVALAELVVYLAKSPKSNSIYLAYQQAAEDVNTLGNLPIPLHILNSPTKFMEKIGYGKGYDYYHSPTGEKKQDINYFPDKLNGREYLPKTNRDH
jgi:putative ATPase